MAPCDYHDQLLESLETETINSEMQAHLEKCPECRAEQQKYSRLIETLIHQKVEVFMDRAEKDNRIPREKLPSNVKELVQQRKKTWMKEQLKKTLGSQGLTDKEEQQKRLNQLLKEPPPDLPLAAFPDDLNEDEES